MADFKSWRDRFQSVIREVGLYSIGEWLTKDYLMGGSDNFYQCTVYFLTRMF